MQYLSSGFFIEISIHAPRTGSDVHYMGVAETEGISIHAPRTGSDAGDIVEWGGADISIHAPRTGSDRKPFA